jgi:UDP-N-acetylglucosamine 2-epimerase (non-hydrolysing)
MKIAPIVREMAQYPGEFAQILVHTGQHYDLNMSQVFFDELELPEPDANLEVGAGSHAQQTALIMQRFEPVVLNYQPDWVVTPGDVNSTVACALVASKLGIKVAHVESGLRAFDRSMPEEINRVLTDHLADLLFTTEPSGNANLAREGIPAEKIRFVGNTMIDTLVWSLPKAVARWPALRRRYALDDRYILVTLHRPSNVDDPVALREIMAALAEISREAAVVFPIHPRTRQRVAGLDLRNPQSAIANLKFLEPLGYLDFLALEARASLVLTDSGGVQEETTYLGVPCLTARPNTERPVTITHGTNRLVASRAIDLVAAVCASLANAAATPAGALADAPLARPALWDGCAAKRLVPMLS